MGFFKSKLDVLASETPISDYVPYSRHVTDTIVSTKNAEYLSVWKLSGHSHQSADLEDVLKWSCFSEQFFDPAKMHPG